MIVVVEGIDRVGKTTLVNRLVNECRFKVFKHNNETFSYDKMDNDNETDKMSQLLDMIKLIGANQNIVFDRFAWSDFVYGIISRNYNEERALKNLKFLEKLMNEANVTTVYVAPIDLERSSKEHGSDLARHHEMFTYLFATSSCEHVMICDYTTIDDIIKIIKERHHI